MDQLPLALRLNRNATFEGFSGAANAAAVAHVRAVAAGERRETVWLAGPHGSGKTHLLSAACRQAAEDGLRTMYLALDQADDPDLLTGLEQMDVLALDRVDCVAGKQGWETALFPLLNARLEHGGLLMSALIGPGDCGFTLADLASRAAAAAIYTLKSLSDEELLELVLRQAAQRGLEFDESAAAYLLNRLSRDPGELMRWLDRIDRYALAEKRRVTIPLLRDAITAAAGDAD